MRRLLLFFAFVLLLTAASRETTVSFPLVSGYRPLTSGPLEHFFASYYGISSWNRSQRFASVLETNVKYRVPTENDVATLGLVEMRTGRLLPLARTRAWNFQQGCMAHWLGPEAEDTVIYNDLREGRFVSVIVNVHTKEEIRILPYPVSAVSPDGRRAVSINFARLRLTRPDYGYGGFGQDPRVQEPFPEDDGLFLVDLETGQAELLVSISEVEDLVPEVPPGGLEYFNHTLFSRDGNRIFWLARATPERNTIALTVETDGSKLAPCFPEGWSGSHFDWLDESRLMITAQYQAKAWSHILFTVGERDYYRLSRGLLDYDGHGTFSPNGQWMVTDTYPNNTLLEQKLFLMDMRTEVVMPLGRFVQPAEFRAGWRCDLHPRWSPNGDLIGFNSTFTGSRQAYVFELSG